MNKMKVYNHPLVKKQQRKQRQSSMYYDEQSKMLNRLLEELKNERNQSQSVPMRTE